MSSRRRSTSSIGAGSFAASPLCGGRERPDAIPSRNSWTRSLVKRSCVLLEKPSRTSCRSRFQCPGPRGKSPRRAAYRWLKIRRAAETSCRVLTAWRNSACSISLWFVRASSLWSGSNCSPTRATVRYSGRRSEARRSHMAAWRASGCPRVSSRRHSRAGSRSGASRKGSSQRNQESTSARIRCRVSGRSSSCSAIRASPIRLPYTENPSRATWAA